MLRAWCIYLGLITPCPETSHLLHLPGTYHPLPRNLPTPTSAWDLSSPAQKPPTSYICLGLITPCPGDLSLPAQNLRPLFNYKCHLNQRLLKTSRLTNVSLIASTNLPLNMKPPWSLSCSAWSLGRLSPLLALIKVTYLHWDHLSFSA